MLVKSAAYAKFDESVDLALRLGVDPKRSDQMVRGTTSLAAWHRQEECACWCLPRVRRSRRPVRPEPIMWGPTI